MKIEKKSNYLLITDAKDSITDFASRLTTNHHEFEGENVIIDILNHEQLELEQLLGFLELSTVHRAHKKSFVIANNSIDIDKIPEELFVAPTLKEAEDIIQMEELERELGF
ncbi:ribonuclease Z [Zunongwangia sp. HRR-M8]|uniref:ribonuclease Z n=1 Tax=Zunongwangia sp. HRR-M8 TaxID=3015170 RepID=UPI0022DD5941|nr:ribonuclease Z [Zunongwangia sp. HRR-M8]WBL23624.1 ribonuclease Z [Zunongwangia sp. HRR-M8]